MRTTKTIEFYNYGKIVRTWNNVIINKRIDSIYFFTDEQNNPIEVSGDVVITTHLSEEKMSK